MVTFLRRFFGSIVALLILFEEWGWEPLQALLARGARLPPLAWIERRLAALRPVPALFALGLPTLLVVPVKLVALGMIAAGHALSGLLTIVAAKVVGTAVLARIFVLTRPALLELPWFRRWYFRWLAWKGQLLTMVRETAVWRAARAAKAWMRARWQRLFPSSRG